jgi:glycosyltransferase involved in cell wall biosynthesis
VSESVRGVRPKTVTFLLPSGGGVPVGGFKVVYEYANGLARRGWHIRVVHPRMLFAEKINAMRASPLRTAREWLGYQRHSLSRDYRPDRWFAVNPAVELLYTMTPEIRYLPPSDVWVATWWHTADWAATYRGAKLYLIQHLETWCGPEADVMATWKLPLRKVVISRWLEEVARRLDEPSEYIPNGLNFEAYGMDLAPEARDPFSVAMINHWSDWKGSSEGLNALRSVKQTVPALKANLFGICAPPPDLPSWVQYHYNPPQKTLRRIYNEASVFLSPSWAEGWALPPAEAMQCGAALAVTDIGGHREYAHHGETALLSPPKDPGALAENVLRLVKNNELRIQLARQGHSHIQQFTWDRAVNSFEAVIENELTTPRGGDPTPASEHVEPATMLMPTVIR